MFHRIFGMSVLAAFCYLGYSQSDTVKDWVADVGTHVDVKTLKGGIGEAVERVKGNVHDAVEGDLDNHDEVKGSVASDSAPEGNRAIENKEVAENNIASNAPHNGATADVVTNGVYPQATTAGDSNTYMSHEDRSKQLQEIAERMNMMAASTMISE